MKKISLTKTSSRLSRIDKVLTSHSFVSSNLLQNYHIQTLFTRFFPYFKASLPPRERKYIALPDGTQLVADCWFQKNKNKHRTIIALSGFEGYRRNEQSRFVKETCYKAYFYGYNFIHLKHRGEGDTVPLTKSVFVDYFENDLEVALQQFESWGIRHVYLMGFSAGGGIALLSTARLKNQTKNILGIVAISAPASMLGTWRLIEKNVLYNKALLHAYKNLVRRRLSFDEPKKWDKKLLNTIGTKQQWFETYMPLWGYPDKFSSLEDYDKKTDLASFLPKIEVPTLIIHAYDDPVSPIEPFLKIENPNILVLLTQHGGHVGFYTTKRRYGDLDGHWAQNRAIEFFRLLDAK